MTRTTLATIIAERLIGVKEVLKKAYENSENEIGHFFIDDLLPAEIAAQIATAFPPKDKMMLKKNLGEFKYVAAQMNQYDPLLEEIIYAFQDERVVNIVSEICGIPELVPDEYLYAGGISLMAENNFLHPHLDNSHDKNRDRWRVLNLLYYVTPDWDDSYGGHLEIWPGGLEEEQTTVHSRYNRLVVMATHQRSWHSVSPVSYSGERCCVSNYYFSDTPLTNEDKFHVTSFRARPGQRIRDFILTKDAQLRMTVRKFFKKGIKENPHVYKKGDTDRKEN
ncbi:MAG: Rps23 Pro-64 3,4-dihydroxylase Tpa1-like proline 4-hydroxylase [Patiriisocius sp.]|jgi:Rps23 Pro-64 3,4-dihydroxylase Tpa1-like proline 4-hydroxylase